MDRNDAMATAEQSYRSARDTDETKRRIETLVDALDNRYVIRGQETVVTLNERVPAYLPNRHRICPECGQRRSSHCKTDLIAPPQGFAQRIALPFRKLAAALRDGRDLRRHGAVTARIVLEQGLCEPCQAQRDREKIEDLADAYEHVPTRGTKAATI